jgi:RNA polymerase sigma-70 factor, ECF subfamily
MTRDVTELFVESSFAVERESDVGAEIPVAVGVFEQERPRLMGLAYRLLGSLTDAEDVLQEAWLRWDRADRSPIERPEAWLTTVVSRLGLDRLRARRRDRSDYVGPWLPEPFVQPMVFNADGMPEAAAVLSDSLTTAFLVMLERLSPDERLAVLLVDVFGESLADVAPLVGKSHDACRQMAVRARRKLRALDDARGTTATAPAQLDVARQFVGAIMTGDIEMVKSLLARDAVLTSDGGKHRHAARRPVVGPERIARFLVNIFKRADGRETMRPVWVNGLPGVVVSVDEQPYLVVTLDIRDGLVHRYYSVLNPDKLAALGLNPHLQ